MASDSDYDEEISLRYTMNVRELDKYCNRNLNLSSITEEEYKNAPFDDSCLKQFFYNLQDSLRRYSQWEEIVYTTLYIIISVLAVIGNGLVILAVVRKKAMRTNRNVLILNLAVSNLVLAFTNIPFLWLPSIDFEFPYSRFFCKFANVLPGSNIYCSTLTISVMAIDRYYSVRRLKLVSNASKSVRAIAISLSIWVISFFLSLPLLIYYDTSMLYVVKDVHVFDATNASSNSSVLSLGWRQCRIAPARNSTLEMSTQKIQLIMSIMQVVFLYIVPLFVLSIFNMMLTRFLRTNANQMSRNRIGSRKRVEGNQETKRHETLQTHLSSPSMPSIRSSIAERASASDRRTSRTTSLLIAMAGSYAALWLPFTLISLLLDLDIVYYNENQVAIIERIDQTCKLVSMLSICVNPFLYGFLNTNFRHEFTEIYYRYVRCRTKPYGPPRFTHDFSSIGATRHNSLMLDQPTGFFYSLRRSFRGSLHKFRSSVRSDGNGFHSKNVSTRRGSCSSPRPELNRFLSNSPENKTLISDRIVLDADSEKDSFV